MVDGGITDDANANTYEEKDNVNEIHRSRGQRSPSRCPRSHGLTSVRHGMRRMDPSQDQQVR